MARMAEVHWHEGLFLRPHHLQTMQRHLGETIAAERRLGWHYPYGLIEADVSADAMENLQLCFDRLRVAMPSGVLVDVPSNCDLPALDIKHAFESTSGSFEVSLGIPLWYANRGNTIDLGNGDDWRVKRLFRVAESERPDENTGEDPQPVLVRRINARLLLDSDDRTDLEVMPLVRIAHAAGEDVGLPRQDPSFIPACLVLSAWPILRDLARDLANQVDASRKELVIQLTRGGFSIDTMRGVQFEQMLRLQTLNRFAARLPALVQAPATTPFDLYIELRTLLSELAALHPDRDQFEVAPYDHDRPAVCFQELNQRIRDLLRGAVLPKFDKVAFTREGDIFMCELSDEQLTLPNEYFLGIKTRDDPTGLAALVEDGDKFKLMARSMVTRNIWGVKLKEERHPPLELPSEAGLHYFRLVRSESERMWDRIRSEKAAALRWLGIENTDFDVTLYMTVPQG